MSIPLIVGQLGAVLQSFADTIMVGQYGTMELSASGFVNQVFNLVIFFLLGISYGATPLIGAQYGRGDKAGMSRTLRGSMMAGGVMTLAVVALLCVLYFNIDRLGQPSELLPLIRPYFLTQLASLPMLALFNAAKQYYDATGDTRTPMWVMLMANVLNIVLNYMFIFGHWGCAEMGLTGAGIATFTARCMMAVVLLIMLRVKVHKVSAGVVQAHGSGMRRSGLMVLRLGLPIAIQLCLEASSFNICAIFMGWLGVVPLAAHQVMCTISTLCFQVLYGIGAAASILVSQYRGQEDWTRVRSTVRTAYVMSLTCAVVMVVVLTGVFRPITGWFTTSDEVRDVLYSLLPLMVIYQFGDCTQITFAGVLRGLEAVKRMMLYAFVAYIVVSIPLSYVLAFPCGLGSVGVWCGMPVGLTTAGVLFWREYRRVMRCHI